MRTLGSAVLFLFSMGSLFAVETDNADFIRITVKDQSVTYRSNENLLIEKMLGDRWLCSYRSADDRFPIGMPASDEVFYLKIGDKVLSDGWNFISVKEFSSADNSSREVVVNLSNPVNAIDLSIHTSVDGTAIYSRWLEIQ